ncbi:MAG: fibrobacter succinogenes major paralogous domain-containing protein [Dysgonamonadaceae bacterium]|jgi:uncharacterized protein (TIGR02145 family)|nr:fibrobacter succinogenes major paralogous domain-containing protein [Dysgonamonadaceae bacterium]
MKKNLFCLMLALVMISAASVNGQVLIGDRTNGNPHAGAILDLAPPSGQDLGLLLPNVALSNNANAFTLGSNVDGDQITAARGMIVYNTTDDLRGPGIYVWNGTLWIPLIDPCPSSVKDLEGNHYSTGWFGAAGCWMTQNLRSTYNDILDKGLTEFSDYFYPGPFEDTQEDKKTAFDNHKEYGLLYKWAAATGRANFIAANEADTGGTTAETDHPRHQGICPENWHVPSDYEWNMLEKAIAESGDGVYSTGEAATTWDNQWRAGIGDRGTTHGKKMKTASEEPINELTAGGTSKGKKENGFDALLVGYTDQGNNMQFGGQAAFLCSSAYMLGHIQRVLTYNETGMKRRQGTTNMGESVRCKKD